MNIDEQYKKAIDLHYLDRYEESQSILTSLVDSIDHSLLHRVYFNMGLNAKYLKKFKTARELFVKSIENNRGYSKPYAALHELYAYNYEWKNGFRFYDYNYSFDIFHYDYETSKQKRLDWEDPHVQRAISIKFNKDISQIKDVNDNDLDLIYRKALVKVKDNVIHVIATQGLGDVIQTSNLVLKLLLLQPKKIILSVSKEVVRLFGDLDERIEVCCQKLSSNEYDYFIPMMSLIKLIGADERPVDPWLQVREIDSYFASQMINNNLTSKTKIGINWRGNPLHTNDSKRSISLQKILSELGDTSNREIFSFQYKPTNEELQILHKHNIKDLSPLFSDMYDMAMYLMNMDILVTIDSSPLHLAGALGVRTFGMIPDGYEDWRWGNTKEKAIYKNLSLIRFKV